MPSRHCKRIPLQVWTDPEDYRHLRGYVKLKENKYIIS
jgi:hypothetical protein